MKRLSLNALTKLAEEIDVEAMGVSPDTLGCVGLKVRGGRGAESAPLLLMTFRQYVLLRARWIDQAERVFHKHGLPKEES